jgi:methionine-rich copper-binding protein CopC
MGSQSLTMPVKTTVADDGQGKLSKGSYTVSWTAASADGHKTTGSLSFQVR